jgi:hypothetical protein
VIAYPTGLSVTALGGGEILKIGITFLAISFVDWYWTKVNRRIWGPTKTAYYLVNDRGEEVGLFGAVLRRGVTDGVYYTAMLFVWAYSYDPDKGPLGESLGGSLWFARNLAHRVVRKATWRKLVDWYQSKRPPKGRRLAKYGADEYTEIYVNLDDSGGYISAFIWNWRDGEKNFDLDKVLRYRNQVVNDTQGSWEELAEHGQNLQLMHNNEVVQQHVIEEENLDREQKDDNENKNDNDNHNDAGK